MEDKIQRLKYLAKEIENLNDMKITFGDLSKFERIAFANRTKELFQIIKSL